MERQGARPTVTDQNRLSLVKPEIAETLNEELSGFSADEVSVGSNAIAYWDCPDAMPDHMPWPAVINNRTGGFRKANGTGCPDCKLVQTSAQELRLKAELCTVLPLEVDRTSVRTDRTEKVDMVADSAAPVMRLILEFDGSWYHQDKGESDSAKAERLRGAGWVVVRIREAPLAKLDPVFDVEVGFLASPEDAAAAVLDHLAQLGLIAQDEADAYQAHGRPLAAATAREWIRAKLGERAFRVERRAHEEAWNRMYSALVEFEELNGHCYPSDGEWEVEGVDLGRWARKQRGLQRRGKLRDERLRQLDGIASWSQRSAYEAEFWQGYERYVAHAVAKSTEDRAGRMLQRTATIWASNLRSRRKALQDCGEDLPADQLTAMAKVPGWSWTPYDDQFQAKIDALWQFFAATGRPMATIKQQSTWNGHPVGVWIASFRTRRQQLGSERQQELEGLPGWSWNPQQEQWERNLGALRRFAEDHGHTAPSRTSLDPGERALGDWKRNNKHRLKGRDDPNANALRKLLKQYGEDMP